MSLKFHSFRQVFALLGGIAAVGLVQSGCAPKCPHARHAHHGHHGHHGHKAGCGCTHHAKGHAGPWMWKKMMKAKRKGSFGAPKMLCAGKLMRKAKWLGITDDQKAKLKALKDAKHAAADAMRPKIHAAYKALRDEWRKDQPDAAKLQTLTKAFLQLKQQKMQTKIDYLVKVQAVTNAAQWKRILVGKKHRKGFHGRKGWKGRKGGKGYHGRKGRKGHKKFRFKKLGAPKMLCPKMLVMHAKWLGLSADQVTKLKALRKAQHAAMLDTILAKKRTKVAMKAEWLKDQPDAAKLRELAKTYISLKMQKMEKKVAFLAKVQAALTPDQWKKILAARGGHGMHRGHHKGCTCKGHHGHHKGCTCKGHHGHAKCSCPGHAKCTCPHKAKCAHCVK